MRTAKVTLNGKEFEIQELRSRANSAWRKSLQEPFDELAKTLEGATDVSLTDSTSIADLIQGAASLAVGSVDTIVKLLFAYAPELKDVAEEAYDSELMEAFGAVLSLAYPFGGVIAKIQAAMAGPEPKKTKAGPEKEQTKQN